MACACVWWWGAGSTKAESRLLPSVGVVQALWLKRHEAANWAKAETVCEYQDFVNFKLTGRWCVGSCGVATRWHWDAKKVLDQRNCKQPVVAGDGRPLSLLERIDLRDLAEKWPYSNPTDLVATGEVVGGLSAAAAEALGLPEGIPVAQVSCSRSAGLKKSFLFLFSFFLGGAAS